MKDQLKERVDKWKHYTHSIILKTKTGGMFQTYLLRTENLLEDLLKDYEFSGEELEEIFGGEYEK